MALLIGSNTPRADSFSPNYDDLFSDDRGDNYEVILTGVSRYFARPYKTGAKLLGLEVPKVSPLEFALAIADVQNIKGDSYQPTYYLELNPFDMYGRVLGNGLINLQKKTVHYGTIHPLPSKEQVPEGVIKIERTYLLPAVVRNPFYSQIISRRQLKVLVDHIKESNNSNDPQNMLNSRINFYRFFENAFGCEDLSKYKRVKRKLVPPEVKNLPVFSLVNFGRENLEDLFINWKEIPSKSLKFIVGSKNYINRELTEVDKWRFHCAQMVASLSGYTASMNWLMERITNQQDLIFPSIMTALFWAGLLDGAYRMVKHNFQERDSPSGIIGDAYSRLTKRKI